jgi:hypothetical protein
MRHDPAVRAIARLANAQHELELAARAPGEIITISRQAADAIRDDLGAAARAIRELAENHDG